MIFPKFYANIFTVVGDWLIKILFSTFMRFFNMIDNKNLKFRTTAGRGHFKLLGPP